MNDSAELTLSNPKLTSSKAAIAFVALILGVIGIGFAPIFVRLSSMSSFAIGFWRLALALPFLIAMMLISRDPRQSSFQMTQSFSWLNNKWGLFAGFFLGCDLSVWHLSIRYTSIANASVLCNLAPLIVALWGWLILKHRMNAKLIIGLIMAFVGVVVLINPRFSNNSLRLWGDFLGLMTAVFYAGYLLLTIHARKTIDTLQFMTVASLSGAITMFVFNWVAGDAWLIPTLTEFFILFGLAVISQVLGQGLITYAFAHLSPNFSSATLLIQPIIAAMIAWPLFSETLSIMQMTGIIIVLIGIYLTKSS